MLVSEDFFRGFEIIPGNGYLSKNSFDSSDIDYIELRIMQTERKKSVLIFKNEVVAITKWGAQFYDGQAWKEFEMEWGDLEALTPSVGRLDIVHSRATARPRRFLFLIFR